VQIRIEFDFVQGDKRGPTAGATPRKAKHTGSRTGLSRSTNFALHHSLKNQAGETTGRPAPVTPGWLGKNFLQAVRQRETHVLHVRGTHLNFVQEPAHAARLLRSQQMPLARTPPHHFSGGSNLEALGGSPMRLGLQFLVLLHDFLFRSTASRFNSLRSREVTLCMRFQIFKILLLVIPADQS
jgi:hypothetical protein